LQAFFHGKPTTTRRRKHTSTATYLQPEENPYQSGSIIGVEDGVANPTKGNRTTIVIAVTSLRNLRDFRRASPTLYDYDFLNNTITEEAAPLVAVRGCYETQNRPSGNSRCCGDEWNSLLGYGTWEIRIAKIGESAYVNPSPLPSQIKISLIQTSLCFASTILVMPFAFNS
jgi:hypothetical protein